MRSHGVQAAPDPQDTAPDGRGASSSPSSSVSRNAPALGHGDVGMTRGATPAQDAGTTHIALDPSGPTTVGSARENTVVVTGTGVAPQHARIERDRMGRFRITDLDTDEGTHINGIPVGQATLLPGAEIRIGDNRLLFTGSELLRYDASQEVRVDAIDLTETSHQGGLGLLGGHRKVLLDDVSITLLPGTFVAIVGASGAGKTTLLRALMG